jgi:hypothetical protein
MILRSRGSLMKIYDQMCFCDYIVEIRSDDGCCLYHLIRDDLLQKILVVTWLGMEVTKNILRSRGYGRRRRRVIEVSSF